MIYCPSCGTANRSGSKFCNQCGHLLAGTSKTTCPACGSANPIGNLFCDSCGAKLAPLVTKGNEEMAGVKGLSLPTKPMDEEEPIPPDEGESPVPQEEEVSLPEEEAEGEEEMPAWLLELREAAEASDEVPEEPEPSAPLLPEDVAEAFSEDTADEEDVPEWLRQLEPEEALPSEEEPPAEEVGQVEEAVEGPAAEAADREMPEPEFAEPEAAPPLEEEPAAVALPPESAAEVEEMEGEVPALAESPEDEEDLAAWLQEEGPVILEPAEEEEGEEEVVFEADAGEAEEALKQAQVPSWIETLAPEGVLPEELGGEFVEEGKLTPEEMGLERAEIPSWLAGLRPGRSDEEAREAEAVEESGVLQGVVGALRLVQDIDPPPSAQTRPMSDPAAAASAQADLFTDLLSRPVASLVKPRAVSAAPKRDRGLPWLATLLLIAAVLLPLFAGGLVPGGQSVPASPQPVVDLAERVQGLQETDIVLVSFDYDPGVSTELDWPARVVLEDLKRQGVKFLLMGVTPTGPGLAARFDIPRERALYLGYLPGHEMGLQRLASNLKGTFRVDFFSNAVSDAPFDIESLNDVALVLTIAASQETVRWWMEQVGTQIDAPIGAVVSGAIEPAVRPYYASHQLVGLVSGWVGAQAYVQTAALPAAEDGAGQAALEAQSLAHLAIAGLIVLGNVIYWGKRLFGRRA